MNSYLKSSAKRECKEGEELIEIVNICSRCPDGCSSCSGLEIDDCRGCFEGYYLVEGNQCVANECPSGY